MQRDPSGIAFKAVLNGTMHFDFTDLAVVAPLTTTMLGIVGVGGRDVHDIMSAAVLRFLRQFNHPRAVDAASPPAPELERLRAGLLSHTPVAMVTPAERWGFSGGHHFGHPKLGRGGRGGGGGDSAKPARGKGHHHHSHHGHGASSSSHHHHNHHHHHHGHGIPLGRLKLPQIKIPSHRGDHAKGRRHARDSHHRRSFDDTHLHELGMELTPIPASPHPGGGTPVREFSPELRGRAEEEKEEEEEEENDLLRGVAGPRGPGPVVAVESDESGSAGPDTPTNLDALRAASPSRAPPPPSADSCAGSVVVVPIVVADPTAVAVAVGPASASSSDVAPPAEFSSPPPGPPPPTASVVSTPIASAVAAPFVDDSAVMAQEEEQEEEDAENDRDPPTPASLRKTVAGGGGGGGDGGDGGGDPRSTETRRRRPPPRPEGAALSPRKEKKTLASSPSSRAAAGIPDVDPEDQIGFLSPTRKNLRCVLYTGSHTTALAW
jgi:hypothetical protein